MIIFTCNLKKMKFPTDAWFVLVSFTCALTPNVLFLFNVRIVSVIKANVFLSRGLESENVLRVRVLVADDYHKSFGRYSR